MTVRKDTIFEQFLAPVVWLFVDEKAMQQLSRSIDWETESDRLTRPDLEYPDYYITQNFHGIERGYLNPGAAVSYDPITQYAMPPHEGWIRQGLIDAIRTHPRRILDLGCGTGSTTIRLKQAFPDAEVIGLDLSPYMLVMAQYKAKQAGLEIQWVHGPAEQTGFAPNSFDLVTASLLFHETPAKIAQAIAQESFRLLQPGGQFLILDGNQKTLRQTEWLTQIFEEPYIQEYADGSVDAWMGAVGFGAVQTSEVWLLNQVTSGIKPLPQSPVASSRWTAQEESWVVAPSY